MRILKNKKGESIIEVLASLIIIMVSIVALTTAIISANKSANTMESSNYSFKYVKGSKDETADDGTKRVVYPNVTITLGESSQTVTVYEDNSQTVTVYEDNGYYFFE